MEKKSVQIISVDAEKAGQRIDNFLLTLLKKVPKTHIYRILRKGEVRVNKKRVKPTYRLCAADQIRIPPLQIETKKITTPSESLLAFLKKRILYESDQLLIINKPFGIPVHGGNDVKLGIIEALRALYPKTTQLELVHRLDRDTSGCLMIAKKRSMLRKLHELLRESKVKKIYWALTKGHWAEEELRVDVPLLKNQLKSGERMVRVESGGKPAQTQFTTLKSYNNASLMEVLLETGRTHQIRVHAQYRKHPIAGDEKYGDRIFNKSMKAIGLNRMFLHAYSLSFSIPDDELQIVVNAPLEEELESILKVLE